jgi:transcriptional regulator with XRE-family HTH domain
MGPTVRRTGTGDELTAEQSLAVAEAVREELARRRMSRQRLADTAKISLSTLEKTLSGSRQFTLATIVRLEQALSVTLRSREAPASPSAPAALGAYSRAAVQWLEGDYLTLRPSFEMADTVFAYRTAIAWDSDRLVFHEAERSDAQFSQKGEVSLPNKSGHVYLHTNDAGQMRLAILGRPRIGGEMYGLLTTLQVGSGTQLLPVAVPLALIPLTGKPALGRIGVSDEAYGGYRAHLDRVTAENFARLIGAR